MSLLNKVFEAYNGHRVMFSQPEAIAAIAASAIASDGYLLEQETDLVITLLSQMEVFKGYSEKQITNMLNRLLSTLSVKGINNVVAIANNSLHPEYKEAVFMLATEIILVDGVLCGKEQAFLIDLFQVLEISSERASQIFTSKSEAYRVTNKKSKNYRINQGSLK